MDKWQERQYYVKKHVAETRNLSGDIEQILRNHSEYVFKAREATKSEDMTQGFDFRLELLRRDVGVRIRGASCRYRDFTLRSKALGGSKTELDKIREGLGDLYLYAWLDSRGKICEYVLVCLHALRAGGLSDDAYRTHKNTDGTAMAAFSLDYLRKINALKVHVKK